ncbi:MAG: protocadherin [Pirellulales bacterium]
MKRTLFAVAMATIVSLTAADAWARGGGGRGGGGFGGGGGGARVGGGGGFSGGGMSRPAPSRPSPASRPNMGNSGMANRAPSMSRPNFGEGGMGGAGGNRVGGGAGAANRPGAGGGGAYSRPSQRDVASFLNMPEGGAARAGGAATASTRDATRTAGSKTVTGPGGGSITVGGVGGTRTGPGGTTVGGVRGGVKVTGPGGNSYTKVGGAAGVRGPYGNTIAAGRGASFVNGQFVGGKTWGAVNGNFHHWGYYGPGWAARYPGCWWPGRWAVAGGIWATAAWATAGAYCGCSGDGYYYDYDENMSYQDGNVYYGDQSLGTTEEYYNQTSQLAQQGQDTSNEDWLPLGVYGLVEDGATEAEKVIQLAVNKEGAIRGNYHDLLTDQVIPITGSVDKQTQKVAFRLEGKSQIVVETGLYNLTNDECPVLIHMGDERQASRVLVRLKQPEEGDAAPQ